MGFHRQVVLKGAAMGMVLHSVTGPATSVLVGQDRSGALLIRPINGTWCIALNSRATLVYCREMSCKEPLLAGRNAHAHA
jgi:hypothetical protein